MFACRGGVDTLSWKATGLRRRKGYGRGRVVVQVGEEVVEGCQGGDEGGMNGGHFGGERGLVGWMKCKSYYLVEEIEYLKRVCAKFRGKQLNYARRRDGLAMISGRRRGTGPLSVPI